MQLLSEAENVVNEGDLVQVSLEPTERKVTVLGYGIVDVGSYVETIRVYRYDGRRLEIRKFPPPTSLCWIGVIDDLQPAEPKNKNDGWKNW